MVADDFTDVIGGELGTMTARSPVWKVGSMLTPWVVTRATSPVARAPMTARPATTARVAVMRRSRRPAMGTPFRTRRRCGPLTTRTAFRSGCRYAPGATTMSVVVMSETSSELFRVQS